MINWGLSQGSNSFQNALSQGVQIGSMIRRRNQQEESAKAEAEGRNALAGYAMGNEDQFGAAVQYDPRAAMGIRGDMQAQESAAAKREQEQLPTMARLLDHASKGPEQWAQAMQAAQRAGIPLDSVPQQFDPQWAAQQAQTLQLLQTPQGQSVLSTIGKEVADGGFTPGTPEFSAEVNRRWTAEQTKTIAVPPGGYVARYNPTTGESEYIVAPAGVAPDVPPPPPGFEFDGGGAGSNASGGFPSN